MKKIKVVALLIAMVTVLSLVGCSKKESASTAGVATKESPVFFPLYLLLSQKVSLSSYPKV